MKKTIRHISILIVLSIVISLIIMPAGVKAENTDSFATIMMTSTSLNSKTNLNFYVAVPDSVAAQDGAFARFTDLHDSTKSPVVQMVSEVRGDSYYFGEMNCFKFSYEVVAKEFGNIIKFELIDGSGEALSFKDGNGTDHGQSINYSVETYLKSFYNNDTDMGNLARAMRDYSYAARKYFGYRTDDLTLSDELLESGSVNDYAVVATGTRPQGIERITTSMLLESDNSVRMYYSFSEGYDPSNYSFKLDGVNVTPVRRGNQYYVEVSGIIARKLNLEHILITSDGTDEYTVKFSALSYAAFLSRKDYDTDPNGVNLGKALCRYYDAAFTYFGTESKRTGKSFRDYDYVSSNEDFVHIQNILDDIIDDDMTEVEKIIAVHDWEVLNIAYDYTFTSYDIKTLFSRTPYSTVCDGYSKLFYVMINELGIPCERVTGTAGESHAWNVVQLNDGCWYFVDVTWDDVSRVVDGSYTSDFPNGENIRYKYCLMTLEDISVDHTAESTLPSPLGTSSTPHNDAITIGTLNEKARITSRLASGDPKYGYIIDSEEDIALAGTYLADQLATAAGKGDESFTFSIFIHWSLAESTEEIASVYNAVLGDVYPAANSAWGGCTAQGSPYYVRDTYTEMVWTVSKPST